MPAKSQTQQEVGAAAFSARRAARSDGWVKNTPSDMVGFRPEKHQEYFPFSKRNGKPRCV
jgi:hypothetical protein